MKPDEVTIQQVEFHFSCRLFLSCFITFFVITDFPTPFPVLHSSLSSFPPFLSVSSIPIENLLLISILSSSLSVYSSPCFHPLSEFPSCHT